MDDWLATVVGRSELATRALGLPGTTKQVP